MSRKYSLVLPEAKTKLPRRNERSLISAKAFARRAAISSLEFVLGDRCDNIKTSFKPDILGEIIVGRERAVEAPVHLTGLIPTGKYPFEENLLVGPAGVRLWCAVAARHGVVEPSVRRVLVDMNVVAFVVF